MSKLKSDYENACNNYLKAFCEKHDYDYEEDAWVNSNVGGIAYVCDYFIDMDTIRTDIDTSAPKEEFLKWYDYCIELHSVNIHSVPNFKNWLKGIPILTKEDIEKLTQAKSKAEESKKEFLDLLDIYNK